MIEVGAKAPDFTLTDQKGTAISLADFAGSKLVLCFYPLDFSPVCTDQLSVYQEVLGEIEARGGRLAGISVDSQVCHKAFAERIGTEIPLLADFHPKGEVCEAYDALIAERGHANRSLVLVEDGEVRWVHEASTPLEIPGANLIFDALESTS
ncbi:MAG: redoxin domain-containing protein [Solirubrobacterales bacterium]